MKLSADQHAELGKMSRYFNHIEEIADKLGVEIDVLSGEQELHPANLKNLHPEISVVRRNFFNRYIQNGRSERVSIVNLHVIVNEDRF